MLHCLVLPSGMFLAVPHCPDWSPRWQGRPGILYSGQGLVRIPSGDKAVQSPLFEVWGKKGSVIIPYHTPVAAGGHQIHPHRPAWGRAGGREGCWGRSFKLQKYFMSSSFSESTFVLNQNFPAFPVLCLLKRWGNNNYPFFSWTVTSAHSHTFWWSAPHTWNGIHTTELGRHWDLKISTALGGKVSKSYRFIKGKHIGNVRVDNLFVKK